MTTTDKPAEKKPEPAPCPPHDWRHITDDVYRCTKCGAEGWPS